jgi:L-ribulose-5-phosphate 3-epimerase
MMLALRALQLAAAVYGERSEMNRRDLLKRLPAGATGCLLLSRLANSSETVPGFKLGFTTDEVTQDLEAALRFAREFKLKWVEIRKLWDRYVTETSPDDLKKAKRLCDGYGIRVSVLDTALFKCALPGTKPLGNLKDDYPYQEQGQLLDRAIERSEILDTEFIRIFSFWRVADPERVWDRVVELVSGMVERARAHGRILLLENVGSAMVETSAESARLLKAIPSPGLGLAWDPSNAFCAGEKPFPDGYAMLDKTRIRHIHLRDADRDPGTDRCQWLPVGKGSIDNLGLFRALIRDRYQGTLSLETHYRRPDGNRELATRESLSGLLALMRKAREEGTGVGI